MEALAIAYAYAAYEEERGISQHYPDLIFPKLLPSSRWLAYVGILILSAQMVISQVAIASAAVFAKPISGATVEIKNGCLNARETPQGKIIACLGKGAILKDVIKEENGWYQLSSGNWVASAYVKLPNNAETTKAATPPPVTTVGPKANNKGTPAKTSPQNVSTQRTLMYQKAKPLQGDDVRLLQEHLNWYKLLAQPLNVDGVFGTKTKLAVEAFQQQKNLTMDGVVGAQTREALKL
jgi:hypothetical protein